MNKLNSSRAFLLPRAVALAVLVSIAAMPWAALAGPGGPGHTHDEEASIATGEAAPRTEAHSELFEFVGVFQDGEGGHAVHGNPEAAAKAFAGYGGKGSIEDLATMLRSQQHGDSPVGGRLKQQLALYGDELKLVNVLKRSTDTATFAERIYADVLS